MSWTSIRRNMYLVAVAWIGLLCAGFAVLLDYSTAPGALADAPRRWPAESAIAREPGRPTLVLFVHPHCPCTRASIGELARLMRRVQDRAPRTIPSPPCIRQG